MAQSESLHIAREAFLAEVQGRLSQLLQAQGISPREGGLSILEHERLRLYALPAEFSGQDAHKGLACLQFSLEIGQEAGVSSGDYTVWIELHGDHAHAQVRTSSGEWAKGFQPQITAEAQTAYWGDRLEVTNHMLIHRPDGGRIFILNALLGWQGKAYQLGIMLN
jgi:hypothetical protein